MNEYVFVELGYFTASECQAIKDELQDYSFMHFDITWSNNAGNCILIVRTDYDDTPQNIKNLFLHCALSKIREIKRR